MIEQLKKLWATPSAEVLALRELEDAKRQLLESQTTREYADSMVKFREQQIKRLTAYLKGME
jgi:hypothetical protein